MRALPCTVSLSYEGAEGVERGGQKDAVRGLRKSLIISREASKGAVGVARGKMATEGVIYI